MITLLTGRTGTGKSYYSVETIINTLAKDRKVFTNIKMNYSSDNFYYLDELGMRSFLQYIEKTFVLVQNLEEKKNELRNSIYFGAFFFIDEAHLIGFSKKTESILNWLTLHRHFDQDIFISTQIPQNLHRDYLPHFHGHIDMISQNKRIAKGTLGYKRYDSYGGERLETKFFKPDPNIFEIYNSGKNEQAVNKNVYKLFFLIVGLLVIAVVFWKASTSFLENSSDFNTTVSSSSSSPSAVSHTKQSDLNVTDTNLSDNIGYVSDDAIYPALWFVFIITMFFPFLRTER